MKFVTKDVNAFQPIREMRVGKAPSVLKLVARSSERFLVSAILADTTKRLLGVVDPECEIHLHRTQDVVIVFEGPDDVDCYVQTNARDQKVEGTYETFTSLEVNRLSAEERAMKLVEREIAVQRQQFEKQLERQRRHMKELENGLSSRNQSADKAKPKPKPGVEETEDGEGIESPEDAGDTQRDPPS